MNSVSPPSRPGIRPIGPVFARRRGWFALYSALPCDSRGRTTVKQATVRTPSGPKIAQAEGDRIEGADTDRVVVPSRSQSAATAHRGARMPQGCGPRGSTSHRCRERLRGHRGGACSCRSRLAGRGRRAPRRPNPERGSRRRCRDTPACRSRRQPARSGTTISSPRCSSGSSMIHHPPGPPRPLPKGLTSSSPRFELTSACGIAGRGWV